MLHLLWLSLAIPVLIHLVHRRKAKRVPFSTLRFLRMVDQRVARRHRLKELLLLAVRILVLAAVIGALYRPMIRSATFKGVYVPTAAAIVLDNTYSMQAVSGGMTRFDRARSAAVRILDALKRGDSAVIVPFDAPDRRPAEPETGTARLKEAAAALECGYGTADAAAALRQAVQSLTLSNSPRKEMYVITDFQRLSWSAALAGAAGALPPDVPVFLVDVGGPVQHNLALEEAAYGLNAQVAGAAAELFYTLRNTGLADEEKELALFVNGQKVADRQVKLAAGGRSSGSFSHLFSRQGAADVEVKLMPDELAADDVRYVTTTVRDALPVLLVNGDPSAVPHLSETFFLELALRAPARGGRSASPFRQTVVTGADFLAARLDDYACVVLANVPRLPDLWAERLRRYVEGGGGLVIFTGDRLDADSYNSSLAPAGQEPLLPAPLGEVKENEDGFRIRSLAAAHPALKAVAEHLHMERARVTRFHALSQGEGPGAAPALIELDAGPLVVERKVGAGRVILWATSADLDWNNLPARAFFLPLLHQLICYVGRAAAGTEQHQVGLPYVLELPAELGPTEVSFYGPRTAKDSGREEPLSVVTSAVEGGANRAAFAGTGRPGIYRAVWTAAGTEQVRRFAVNVEPGESDLARVDPDEAAQAIGAAHAKVVADLAKLEAVIRRERDGLPLWDDLFALAMALAVAEVFVGNVLLKH
jgi:hypothetical protein